ncbi:MAG: glutamate synthase central domain-containing protein, partial [Myxococcota bacterium]
MRATRITRVERDGCGVGFAAARDGRASHRMLQLGLEALRRVEHRGACAADGVTGDGAGLMAEIPWAFFGYERGEVAVATLFLSADPQRRGQALDAMKEAFAFMQVPILRVRPVPVNLEVLGPIGRASAPHIVHVVLERPAHSRTDAAFSALLYQCKQQTRVLLKERSLWFDLYFVSLSPTTIVYKALCRSEALDQFYPDLANPRFLTRFSLFHRRFSTNTRTSWDKAQPFRLLGHNGEINTITGNRSSAFSREHAVGLREDELLTHRDISDSGSLNEMVEALKYRSAIPHVDDILAITIPPADEGEDFYTFWGRAMEPWDGPALVVYSDGETVGARLDRNGFRPARWLLTDSHFCLASEAGVFDFEASEVRKKGTLEAGSGATLQLATGRVHLRDPSQSRENAGATFDPRLVPIERVRDQLDPALVAASGELVPESLDRVALFGVTDEELRRVLRPMAELGKEPVSSMGDTARPAIFSDESRSFYDFFSQRFAQVTNPPLDYLREGNVTDLRTFLGIRPNIFYPKELLPPAPGIVADSPVLSLEDMACLRLLTHRRRSPLRTIASVLDTTFAPSTGSLQQALDELAASAVREVAEGCSLLVLSDREASRARLPIPSLLAVRAVVCALNQVGARLRASVVVEAGDIRSTHQVACAIGFGATAVCPYLALELARFDGFGPEGEARMGIALRRGLLKVMSKMGISVVRSYQSSKLFTAFGLGPKLIKRYFNGVDSPLGGYELEDLEARWLREHAALADVDLARPLPSTHQLKEKPRAEVGERHSMTVHRSKLVHDLVRGKLRGRQPEDLEAAFEHEGKTAAPTSPRHLLTLRPSSTPVPIEEVESVEAIAQRFCSGAMSFGAISAKAQRDIFVAMNRVGGRSNSGEGGENPYYYLDGTCATVKQVASGRFGVTAEYVVSGEEVEIKIAQGAKPGEGGQLMGAKVTEQIAFARHAKAGSPLISPPPLHDLYSIE